MIDNYASWIIRWRYLVILTMLIMTLTAMSGLHFLQFKSDYRVYFNEDNPQLIEFENMQNIYTKDDNVLLVLAPKDGQIFTQKWLTVIEKLTHEAWQLPYSIRVDSLTNFQYSFAEEDHLTVAELVPKASLLTPEDIERIREIALQEPLLYNRLISPRADVTGINVTIQLPGKDLYTEVPKVVTFARELVAKVRAENPDLDVYLTGMVVMSYAFQEVSERDMIILIPLMFFVVLVALQLTLHIFSGTLVTVSMMFLAILAAMGISGWLGIALSPPSAVAPIIILTVAIADGVHVLTRFVYELQTGKEKYPALVASLRINFQPIFLTNLTTMIGFLSMNFSSSPPFRDLGNMVAIGVGFAYVFTITWLPAMTMILPVPKVPRKTESQSSVMMRLVDQVIERQKILFWGIFVLIIILVPLVMKNELNDEFIKYFDASVPFRQASDFTSQRLTGVYYINYSLGENQVGGIADPTFLTKLEEFARWYQNQPETLHVSAITDIFKRLTQNMHGDDPSWYRLPETWEEASQYLLLYEMSLPYGLDLNNQINLDKSTTKMVVAVKNLSSKQLLALEQRAQQWLKDNAPSFRQTSASSPALMFAHIGQQNIYSTLIGTLIALVLISFTMIFSLGSLKIGLISLVPNLIPLVISMGLWGLFVGQIGLASSVVADMALGIVVDDTIHFLNKYLYGLRKLNLTPPEAVRHAFATVGTALWTTTLVLVIGFLVLTLSSFKANSEMGLLTAITLAVACIADFLFLPPLLMKLEKL